MYIGSNIFLSGDALHNCILGKRVLIVTDQQVSDLYLKIILSALDKYEVQVLILQAGEDHKNFAAVSKIIDALVAERHDRESTLLSLGGGIIGDLTGFAASIYMRGMHWIQVPTTLLAQVDAAIGGKTGCNYAGLKNLLGTFYQPSAVIIDSIFLDSISTREFTAGIAEVIKYGMACDGEFFLWIEKHILQLKQRDNLVILEAITRCCRIKLRLVEIDEHDHGPRMALNFGHTFAHALESATKFKFYLHGEAVAIGMLLATHLAVKLGYIENSIYLRLEKILSCLALPLQVDLSLYSVDELFKFMLQDKKNSGSGINMILPCAVGEVKVLKVYELDFIEELLKDYVSP